MKIEPVNFTDPNYVEMYKDEFMFLSCIKFISKVKQIISFIKSIK
jgi:hypothetical protein